MDENLNQNNKNNGIPNIKTYSSDMADVIRQKEMSVIKIAMAEKEKREQEKLDEENNVSQGNSSLGKFFLIFGGIVLVAGALGGLYYLNQKKINPEVPVVTENEILAIISYDEKSSINIPNKNNITDITNIIKTEKEKIGKSKSVRAVFLTETINNKEELLPLVNILSLTGVETPSPIKRSLSGEYMLGVFTPVIKVENINTENLGVENKTTPSLFLILKVTDYNISYAGMLEWEQTMQNDFKNLFTLSSQEGVPVNNLFKDILINNKDVRVMYNQKEEGVLYYLFADKNTLVITDNEDTIKEVTARLANKKR